MTCEEDASHACIIDLGILHCPKTCGYCAPFEYERMKRFGKPQITLLPSVLYQTRMKEAECHGFATVVQSQNYNPVLTLLPALDGKKKGNWPHVAFCVVFCIPKIGRRSNSLMWWDKLNPETSNRRNQVKS